MYSPSSATLPLLLAMGLLLRSCVCQTQSFSDLDLVLSTECPSNSSDVWWKPLEWNGQDPCALSHRLRQRDNAMAHIGCCSLQSGMSSRTAPCGPCNLQTYNIAVACYACAQPSTLNVTTVVVQSEIGNNSLVIPTTKQWQAGQDQPSGLELNLPSWVLVPPDTNDKFNVERVVQNATQSSPGSTSLNLSASPVISPPSSTSSPGGHTAFTIVPPIGSPSPPGMRSTQQLSSSHKNAGVVAGGVLGGAISLALIALAILLIRRRRRMHLAPSAEFMPVVGTRVGYTMSQDDSPPPFSPGMWRDPILEKVHSVSTT